MGIENTLQEEGRRKKEEQVNEIMGKEKTLQKGRQKERQKEIRKKQGEKNKQTNCKANWKLKKLKESSSSILFLTFKCEK